MYAMRKNFEFFGFEECFFAKCFTFVVENLIAIEDGKYKLVGAWLRLRNQYLFDLQCSKNFKLNNYTASR